MRWSVWAPASTSCKAQEWCELVKERINDIELDEVPGIAELAQRVTIVRSLDGRLMITGVEGENPAEPASGYTGVGQYL